MKMITRKIGGSERFGTISWAINRGIDKSLNIESFKKKFGIRKGVQENSLEWQLVKNKAVLIATPVEIHEWMGVNTPHDKRLETFSVSGSDKDSAYIWWVGFNELNNEWCLEPWRHIGHRE